MDYNIQTDSENDIFVEECHIDGEVEISDDLRKYFTPNDITYNTVAGSKSSDIFDRIKKQREILRIVNVKFRLKYIEIDEDNVQYLPDYNVYELTSSLLFKKKCDDLNEEQEKQVQPFFIKLVQLFVLYKADYWDDHLYKFEEHITKEGFNEDIDEVHTLKQLLDKWENLSNVEVSIRKKDKYGSVINSESQKVLDQDLELILNSYIKTKYYNFIKAYKLEKYIAKHEVNELKKYSQDVEKKESLTNYVSEAITILYFRDIKPSFTYSYFEELYEMIHNNTHFDTRLTPTYEFLKIVVPALNRFIEDNAIEKYKKKDKHMLLFAMLRAFDFVPDKKGLELDGKIDVKEDFIKQLLR
ncbi:hypothetical protein [Sphingobacterium composti Ten et al. 2007 non Yoo et al. 2007]|uniref:hypothetical protein n=1 Tax=Sphingobacterium composti TaxID=363260 RepID=UPI001357F6AA|nr:hypothetical protein [Sphingobacterium composti Ten et al. 2007 non Yoo et al. 2007]